MVGNLKRLREAKHISQKQLADAVSVSQQSINKYENHSVEPDIATLVRLADYFDTSVDYLIGNTDIAYRLEKTEPCDLNEEELCLVTGFRKLTKAQRESISMVVKSCCPK